MTDEKPPMPPGMPPMPPMPPGEAPPAPPGMPPMPPMADAPPAPPGMPPMPPMPPGEAPPAPPAPPGMPAMPPMPPMADAPPAPPGMPAMPPMPPMADAPPAPPGMPAMPPMPPMADAPPEMPPMPPMPEAPAADPLMDPLAAPPAPPEMPPMPPMPPAADPLMDPLAAPPAPPEMPPMPPTPEAPAADPLMDPLAAPPAPPEMPPMPPMPPAADPLMDPLAAPPAPPEMPPMPPAADPLMDPLAAPPSQELLEQPPLPDLVPSDLTGEQAGATIRSRAEVETVPGDKLEGTLHEIETTTLNADGHIIKQSVKGTLTVNNPSSEDRIYDIDVMLDNIDATDIGGEHVSVDELEPSKNHTMSYKVNGKQMMTLRERLDTNPSRSQERSLSVAMNEDPGEISLELEVENMSGVELHDVVVTRPIPEAMHFAMTGGAEFEDGTITWNIGRLNAGEKQVISMEGTISVSSTKAIKAGQASATYRADSTLSNMMFRELDAFCRGFTYMRVREDERPDNWKCQAIFENRSSFAVDLVKLQVRMKGSEELLFDIHDVDEDVHPYGKWESEERVVMAQSEPDFTYELSYSVLPRAIQSTEGSMKLEEKKLQVLEADISKAYSTSGLRSYRAQKIQSVMVLENKGSSVINLMRITDDIPGLFDAPTQEQLTIKLDGKTIDDDQFKVEMAEGVTIEKEHKSPDGIGHTMTLTVGTRGPLGLKPGKKIEISYPLNAPDPTPNNTRVDGPARVEFSSERFGPICTREPAETPTIKVIHNRRNFSAGKQAIPLGGKGRYEVLILFENNGDTALSDLYINDVLPAQFEIKDWSMKGANGKRDDVKMTSEEGEGGLHIVWHVPKVEKGERLEVSFDIKGTGEVDAEALNRFHGVHFGDEIESDDLPEVEEAEEEAEVEAVAEGAEGEASEETSEEAEVEAEASEEAEVEAEASEETSEEASTEEESTDVAETSEEDAEAESTDEEPKMNWREDVLLRVMDAAGISDRDAFIAFAADYDSDDNGYLKKGELEDAAKAWNSRDQEGSDNAEEKACGICETLNPADATECSACKFTFE
ncbi:hypothetical protein N9L22_02715 [Candidatus Poseidonia alphae]|nr:hypothetical protein [Candidatus Poseidonia alphae]